MQKLVHGFVLASALALPLASVAQSASAHEQQRRHHGYEQRHHGYTTQHWGYGSGGYPQNAPVIYYQAPVYGYGYTYGYSHQPRHWQRGGYLPAAYRSHSYYVPNYQHHRLYAPPRGHGWYRTDNNDYVLAALATGLIIGVIAAQ